MGKECIFKLSTFLVSVLLLSSCASGVYQVDLIDTPDAFSEKLVNPFPEKNPRLNVPYDGILYATDRLPSRRGFLKSKSDEKVVYYKNERGTLLRLGMGRIEIDRRQLTRKKKASWEEIKKISLEKNRLNTYPLQIKDIEEFGILERSFHLYSDSDSLAKKSKQPEKHYADLINKKLATSRKKDIYIYVHGYNTVFEDPLLVGAELWHYMGYDGVFIAYSWPATPRGLAYLADLDTARLTSRNFRIFLEYLSEQTDAENIHIIGYSMGTRVITYALQDSALIHKDMSHEDIHKKLRIGNVILLGSDLDRGVMAGFIRDGLLNVPRTLNVYMSDEDTVLFASRWLFERRRLGEAWITSKPPEVFIKYLREHPKLRFIDVTKARNATEGNGHHYFTGSTSVSSDVLLTLLYDLTPQQRGLVKDKYEMWYFGDDYLEHLRASLKKIDPSILNVDVKSKQ